VKRTSRRRPQVSADGEGVVSRAGSLLPHELADRTGLTRALSRGRANVFPHQRQHDPGVVLRDLAVSLVDGGDCVSDLGVLREQPDPFGTVASTPTAWRMIERLGQSGLEPLRQARAEARARAWAWGAAPQRIVLGHGRQPRAPCCPGSCPHDGASKRGHFRPLTTDPWGRPPRATTRSCGIASTQTVGSVPPSGAPADELIAWGLPE
jgi:hypothetical protein